MRKYLYSFLLIIAAHLTILAQITVSYSVSPPTFNEDEQITVTFSGINEAAWGVATSKALYLWAWSYDTANAQADSPTNGTWAASNAANKLTYVSPGVYSYTFVPKTFYGNRPLPLSKIGFLVKTLNGSQKSQDIVLPVGKYQLTLTNPAAGSTTFVNAGTVVNISATSSAAGTFQLKANGTVVNSTTSPSTSYSYAYTVTADSQMDLTGTSSADGTVQTKSFTLVTNPSVETAAMPSWMKQGINYDPANPSKVGLALYAPGKSFVHVIGSFNNWSVNNSYLMKRDTVNPDLYWIELTGLTSQQVYTFQYRTNDNIKVADPFSRIILSPDDDPWITSATYPNLPVYPAGQRWDVSVIQTGMPTYPWTVTNFTKPAKEKLAVYELLVRDFTAAQTWQSVIDKIPYLKGLGINAVELMPIMEFDGNNSWGYNPSFHFALDKAYGTSDKFKEFVDKCHQNGIAVILDIALNHATQRNPLVRLWNVDADGDGYGTPSAANPYFNMTATHTYGVNEDFNHSKTATRYYVQRVVEQWISEYKIDGFRWDLTKGFTQNCTTSDEGCTGSYQQDRVDVLKMYADYQWNLDPSSYVIFEHLGTDGEESQWANYRLAEGKGIITWDILNAQYNQNTMGFATNSNFNRVDFENHAGFGERRNISYAESHDEERLMYRNIQYGNSNGSYNVKTLNTGLERQKGIGAVLLAVPGPKMIWQFGELGFDLSINRCANGTVNNNCRTDPKPSAFTYGYDQNASRKAVYNTWARILAIKANNEVFNTKTFTVESGNLLPRIYIWNDALPATSLKNVVILANYELTTQNIVPNFPYAGNWYNLMDNTAMTVTNPAAALTLAPGEFRIYGNAPANVLATDESNIAVSKATQLKVMQNPATNGEIKIQFDNAKDGTVYVYDLSGKLVHSAKVNASKGEQSLRVAGIKSGMYVLQLKSDNGAAVAKVLVK